MVNIKQWRKENKITQATLAKAVGVSMVTVQLWERAVTSPSEENAVKLENAMRELEGKDNDRK